ncbi:MAG: CDGSH iron-sulfur domain-containing protein [Acidobacteria bacterium]|nr:CDGSH iron-sulfur domain-containing protein [Acidobacteriota bacterium]
MADVTITVRKNGPYRVEGPIRLVDAEGNEYDLTGKPAISLCRCGASVNKPFCDGTHSRIGFQAAEAAVRREQQGEPPLGGAQVQGGPGHAAGDQAVPPPKMRTEM